MEQSKKSGSLFNSESEDKESFSSESQEQQKQAKLKIKSNSKQENENINININNNFVTNNQIEIKYITEINKNSIFLNLEKILINQDSLANLM